MFECSVLTLLKKTVEFCNKTESQCW